MVQYIVSIVCPFFGGLSATGAATRPTANVNHVCRRPLSDAVELAAVLFIKRVSETTDVSQVLDSDVRESLEPLVPGKEIPEDLWVYGILSLFLVGSAEKMEDAIEKLPKVLILCLHLVFAMGGTASMHWKAWSRPSGNRSAR